MRSVYLNDGTNVLIFKREDMLNTVRLGLSEDLAKYIEELLCDMQEDIDYHKNEHESLVDDFNNLDEENTELINEKLALEKKVEELESEIERLQEERNKEDDLVDDDCLPF